MALTKTKKTSVIAENKKHDKDTGSTPVQIAILTEQINTLSLHLQANTKDIHSRKGLLAMVNKRKRLLTYLQKVNLAEYQALIQKLNIRK